MRPSLYVVATLAVACSKSPPRFDGPMPITYGDCAGDTTTWVSGPRPLPFTLDEANRVPKTVDHVSTQPERSGRPAPRRNARPDADADPAAGRPLEPRDLDGGAGRLRPPAVTTVSIAYGNPVVAGTLDKAIIRRYLKRNVAKYIACYDEQAHSKPGLTGTLETRFVITPEGAVTDSKASGMTPALATCVADVIGHIHFPKPPDGSAVHATYPLTFVPPPVAGPGAAAPERRPSAPATAHPAVAAQPPAPPPAVVPPRPAVIARTLFRGDELAASARSSYEPGATNPLRAADADLVECLRRSGTPYGAAVVTLSYDSAGGVTGATASGLDDSVATCVADVVKREVKRTAGATAMAQRCSLSFGQMPLDALPAIDVTPTSIELGSASLGTAARGSATIDAVTSAIEARVQATLAPSAPPVSIHGPIVVRAASATPMWIVIRVLRSIVAGGDGAVLAREDNQGWRAIWGAHDPRLPLPPVPLATGGRWDHLESLPRAGPPPPDDERVNLSIFVSKEHVWVGLSRVNEFQELAPNDFAKLEAILKEHKVTVFFADRQDLDIACDDDITYGQVLDLIALAHVDDIFPAWQLTDPEDLDARPEL